MLIRLKKSIFYTPQKLKHIFRKFIRSNFTKNMDDYKCCTDEYNLIQLLLIEKLHEFDLLPIKTCLSYLTTA